MLELQVGAKILLKNSAGKYLLLRRNPKKYPEVGPQWDIVGGRIVPGTSLIENLKREIKEEAGLEYSGQPALIAAQDIIQGGKHVVRLTYSGELNGEPVLDSDHLEFKWFTASEIHSEPALDRYFKDLIITEALKL